MTERAYKMVKPQISSYGRYKDCNGVVKCNKPSPDGTKPLQVGEVGKWHGPPPVMVVSCTSVVEVFSSGFRFDLVLDFACNTADKLHTVLDCEFACNVDLFRLVDFLIFLHCAVLASGLFYGFLLQILHNLYTTGVCSTGKTVSLKFHRSV